MLSNYDVIISTLLLVMICDYRLGVWGLFWLIEQLMGVVVTVTGWRLRGFETLIVKTANFELVSFVRVKNLLMLHVYSLVDGLDFMLLRNIPKGESFLQLILTCQKQSCVQICELVRLCDFIMSMQHTHTSVHVYLLNAITTLMQYY